MKYLILLFGFSVIILGTPRICRGANIFAHVQLPFYSHQMTFRPLWLELAKRGHKITLLTTDLMEANENITQVDLSGVYEIMKKDQMYEKVSEGESILKTVVRIIYTSKDILEYQIGHPEVQEVLNNGTKFDLVISEFLAATGLAVAKKLNVPVIGVTSMDGHFAAHDAVGNPTHPVAYPSFDMPFFTNLSFKQRVLSTLFWIVWRLVVYNLMDAMAHPIFEKYLCEINFREDMKNISLIFVNTNPLFNNARPVGPKTINVGGGFHLLQPKPLPKDLQEYLDNSKEGVIYFNLGSSVKSMHLSNKTRDVILKTFSELPYQILWKFETDEFPGKSNNIKIEKWLPQQDVLRHKNVKLFITQGGLQSMEEAIFSYVPMIGMPFFGDQLSNTYKMEAKGCGLSLDFEKLEVETFKGAILEVINNPRYKEKTKELAELVLDQPMTGLEKAVWWTEYVLRHGGTEHFRDPIVDLPLYQYYLLDVISFLIVVLSLIIYVLYIILRLIKKILVTVYVKLFTTQKIKKH